MTELTTSYQDPVHGTRGWLVYDSARFRLAAGGCRVQAGLTAAALSTLAGRMTLKQRVLHARVAGAKCGLDLDPHSPHRTEVLRRFLRFLRGDLLTRLSMGCDMGTNFGELTDLAAAEGIPSIKYAVRRAQGLRDEEFFARLRLLDAKVGSLTVSQRRAGHALAHAALSVARHQRRRPPLRCAVQGFGTLGRGAVYALAESGARIVAVADEDGCATDPAGLDVGSMLDSPAGTPVPRIACGASLLPREAVFDVPADILLLAASENAICQADAARLVAEVVVVGANGGLPPQLEAILEQRGVLVVPDFIGGIGGSASMEVLFGAPVRPAPAQILDGVALLMRELLDDLLERSRVLGSALPAVATALARDAATATGAAADGPPYGTCPYLAADPLRRPVALPLAAQ